MVENDRNLSEFVEFVEICRKWLKFQQFLYKSVRIYERTILRSLKIGISLFLKMSKLAESKVGRFLRKLVVVATEGCPLLYTPVLKWPTDDDDDDDDRPTVTLLCHAFVSRFSVTLILSRYPGPNVPPGRLTGERQGA